MTVLDDAYLAMAEALDGEDAPRLRFYERLADGELFLLLEREIEADRIEPRLFDLEEGMFALVFDRERRLADFTGGAAPFAALSGRVAVDLLQGRGIGLGVNLGAPSAILLPAEAVDWLHGTLGQVPAEAEGVPEEVYPPAGVPEDLLNGLDGKAPAMAGLARLAYLAGVTWKGGRRGHLLAFVDVAPGAEEGLARAVGEALVFSGLDAGEVDVAFLRPSDPLAARLATVALRVDLPEPPRAAPPAAPGSNGPPKLR
ncbi:hypothetical protein BCF33_1330 [Hasllibacter halocynthiae]|uniref:SseB protein N-terminal domain-containing protein n=1 Tax=Hasllibacter halocynthiae TaxID=595589 RepID=A0A2T0X9V1_9RHOB|nr:hypothetical protein [Hasllibacter halocynthiae]PRY95706.1 hypothetical protein BCF33_1330 [Hasllibacter halocynthiae]